MPVADVYSDVSGLVKHVRFACQCPPYCLPSKHYLCLLFRNGGVDSHFAESRVNLLLPHVALYWVHEP